MYVPILHVKIMYLYGNVNDRRVHELNIIIELVLCVFCKQNVIDNEVIKNKIYP